MIYSYIRRLAPIAGSSVARGTALLAMLASFGFAQTQVVQQPQCSFNFGPLTATGATTGIDFHNQGCRLWTFEYKSTGFSVVSIVLQGAPDASGAPGAWATLPGTVLLGTNPATSITGAFVGISVDPANTAAWYRINLTTATGTGSITGRAYGYQNSDCIAPCVVIGPDTPGMPPSQNPVQIALFDGTNVERARGDTTGHFQTVGPTATGAAPLYAPVEFAGLDGVGNILPPTFCSLSAVISLTTSGLAQIVALSSGKQIRVCNISNSFNNPTDWQLEYGTGANCGTGTMALTGNYKAILTVALDFTSGTLNVPASQALCVNLGSVVTGGGVILYALY